MEYVDVASQFIYELKSWLHHFEKMAEYRGCPSDQSAKLSESIKLDLLFDVYQLNQTLGTYGLIYYCVILT